MLLSIFSFFACKKSKDIELSEDNLTICDNNSNCENIFTLFSDVDSNFQYQSLGNFKVFTARTTYNTSQTNLFILAPKIGNSFSLNNNDIKSGRVKIQYISPSGLPVGFLPVGGDIKGKNLLPEKGLDQSKWIIEAKIFLAADAKTKGDQKIKDTLYLKQYFYPNFVFN